MVKKWFRLSIKISRSEEGLQEQATERNSLMMTGKVSENGVCVRERGRGRESQACMTKEGGNGNGPVDSLDLNR
jgi:hypothetical protein